VSIIVVQCIPWHESMNFARTSSINCILIVKLPQCNLRSLPTSAYTIAHVCILTETVRARTCTHPVLCVYTSRICINLPTYTFSMNKPRRAASGRAAFYANSALLQCARGPAPPPAPIFIAIFERVCILLQSYE
jgi:hypothetical protein